MQRLTITPIIILLLLSPGLRAQHSDTFTTSYKNRIITISSTHVDTAYHQVLESEETEYSMSISKHEKPILLSGERIYNKYDVSMPVQLGNKQPGNVKDFVQRLLSTEISKMDEFAELQIVIDEQGKLAYLHING